VPLDGHSFNDAVRLAGVFAKRGEKLLVLEEFLTIKDAIMSFLMLFRQSILSFFIFDTVKEKSLLSAPIGDSCGPIIKSLWNRSFCGDIGIMGILYYFIFKQVFKEVLNINDCLYYCEMHAWEKALNAAKKQVNPNIRTIGFQHATASRNFYHFFYDPKETMVKREISTLPLPNVIACNGDIMYSNSAESGYQNLVKVEAVRQVYLDEILSSPRKSRKGKPVLLVAGSIDKTESTNLITLVSAAFPKMEGFDIRFKGHPSMPFEKLFEEEGVDVSKRGYLICNNNISECLESAWAVLVPTSTVSIEALLYGCEVIIPALPNSMLMSPLADFKGYYHKVTYPEELKETMCKIVNGYTLHSISEYKEFVRNYWCIDRTLPRWTKLLKSNAYYD
jgi:surface carbohydrate biosynthesis protein (TIGR04326 family)